MLKTNPFCLPSICHGSVDVKSSILKKGDATCTVTIHAEHCVIELKYYRIYNKHT